MALVDHLLKKARLLLLQLPAQALNLFETNEVVFLIVAHPFGVIPNDLLKVGTLIKDGNGLVYLFLAFAEQESRVRMVNDVPDLIHETVLKEPDPHPPGTQRGHLGPQAFRTVVTDHGHLVSVL